GRRRGRLRGRWRPRRRRPTPPFRRSRRRPSRSPRPSHHRPLKPTPRERRRRAQRQPNHSCAWNLHGGGKTAVYYKVDRTYLTSAEGDNEQQHDKTPYFVAAGDAASAASTFIGNENGRLLGAVSKFAGDKATATGWVDGRLYIIFVQRGAEAIKAPGAADEAKLR